MAAPDLKSLVKQISGDALFLIPPGLVMPIGMMIRHDSGSNVFCLVWEPGKIYAAMTGALAFFIFLSVGRWRKWRDLRKG